MTAMSLRISTAVLAIGWMVPAFARADDGWDVRAARALDDRATAWFAFAGADRGKGADKVSCASCHTLVPYALGRPALRRVAGAKDPTALEEKVLAQVSLRVNHWDELDSPRFGLFYDFDEAKKVQSRGTEAVLNALLLSRSGRKDETTRLAFKNLWATQVREGPDAGSWAWLDFGLAPWEAGRGRYFGATLAAIAVGETPGLIAGADATVRANLGALRDYLRTHEASQDLHNRAWLLWASAANPGLLDDGPRGRLVAELLAKQGANGGWSLASLGTYRRSDGTPEVTTADGYATGLILHALRRNGLRRDHPGVARGLAWLRANQGPTGAWAGHSLNKNRRPETHVARFMSDAATAFAVLALGDDDPGPPLASRDRSP